ncbi:MAG TPA: hypothetical protein VKH37_09175 [Ferruginibacter sp.]|nr:hypothetical protein [Ferruginibacter sp.]
MDTTPFSVDFKHAQGADHAEIHPCCREGDIVDYGVWMHGKLLCTITRDVENNDRWVVALKNADDEFDDEIIQAIGAKISSREQDGGDEHA